MIIDYLYIHKILNILTLFKIWKVSKLKITNLNQLLSHIFKDEIEG